MGTSVPVSALDHFDWPILRSSSLLSIGTITSTGGEVWLQAEATASCSSSQRSIVYAGMITLTFGPIVVTRVFSLLPLALARLPYTSFQVFKRPSHQPLAVRGDQICRKEVLAEAIGPVAVTSEDLADAPWRQGQESERVRGVFHHHGGVVRSQAYAGPVELETQLLIGSPMTVVGHRRRPIGDAPPAQQNGRQHFGILAAAGGRSRAERSVETAKIAKNAHSKGHVRADAERRQGKERGNLPHALAVEGHRLESAPLAVTAVALEELLGRRTQLAGHHYTADTVDGRIIREPADNFRCPVRACHLVVIDERDQLGFAFGDRL